MIPFLVGCLIVVGIALCIVGSLWQGAADRAAAAEGEAKKVKAEATEMRSRILSIERERDTARLEAGVLRGNAEKTAAALARAYKRIEGMEAGHLVAERRLESEAAGLRLANARQARLLGVAAELAKGIVVELSAEAP